MATTRSLTVPTRNSPPLAMYSGSTLWRSSSHVPFPAWASTCRKATLWSSQTASWSVETYRRIFIVLDRNGLLSSTHSPSQPIRQERAGH